MKRSGLQNMYIQTTKINSAPTFYLIQYTNECKSQILPQAFAHANKMQLLIFSQIIIVYQLASYNYAPIAT